MKKYVLRSLSKKDHYISQKIILFPLISLLVLSLQLQSQALPEYSVTICNSSSQGYYFISPVKFGALPSSFKLLYLDAGKAYTAYQWSNGATTQRIPVKKNGNYSVFVPIGDAGFISSPPFITKKN